jgi:hypothetical protein
MAGTDFSALLDGCKDLLQADANLAGVDVYTEYENTILQKVNRAVSKIGACIVLGDLRAQNTRTAASKPVWLPITFRAEIYELIVVNRAGESAGKSAGEIAEIVAETLHHASVSPFGVIVAQGIAPVQDNVYNLYNVELTIGA